MRPSERFSKTITIPVIIRNGQVTFLYGGNLPPLWDGTEGKLIVSAEDVVDERWVFLLKLPVTVEFLPEETVVGVMVKFDRVWDAKELGWLEDELEGAQAVIYKPKPHDWLNWEIATEWDRVQIGPVFVEGCRIKPYLWNKRVRNPYAYYLVKVRLQETLHLEIRGTSKPRLLNCRCHIPALEKHEKQFADSLNEAYTHISEIFEPTRRSHTGNIFSLCVVKLPTGWTLLDDLRAVCEAEYARWLQEKLRKIEVLPKPEACREEIAQRIEQVLKQRFFAQPPNSPSSFSSI